MISSITLAPPRRTVSTPSKVDAISPPAAMPPLSPVVWIWHVSLGTLKQAVLQVVRGPWQALAPFKPSNAEVKLDDGVRSKTGQNNIDTRSSQLGRHSIWRTLDLAVAGTGSSVLSG